MNKYNSRYRSTTKMKDMNVKSSTYIGFNNKTIRKVLNLELVIMLKYQNIRTFLQKVIFQTRMKKLCVLNTVPWTYAISDLN